MKTIKFNHVLSFGLLLFGFTGSVSAIPITFDNLNAKLLSSVLFTGLGDVDYEIINNTGVTWTDFSFGIGAFLGSPFFDTSNPYPDGSGTPTLLSSSNGPNTILDVFDLNIGQGQVYDLTLRVWAGEFSVVTGGPNGATSLSHDWVSPLQSDNWSNTAAWSAPGTPNASWITNVYNISAQTPQFSMVDGDYTVQELNVAGAASTMFVFVGAGRALSVESNLNLHSSGVVVLDDSSASITTGSLTSSGGAFAHEAGILTVNGGTFAPNAGGHYSIDSPGTGKYPVVKLINGASYTTTGTMFVGNSYNGQVEILSGSTVNTLNGRVGMQAGDSYGNVLVDGNQSKWTNTDDLEIGVRNNGEMTISNHGRVENTIGAIGAVSGSDGVVTIMSGGVWDNSNALYVGGKFSVGGSGQLRVFGDVSSKGRVDVANFLKVWHYGSVQLRGGEIHVGADGFYNFGGWISGTGNIFLSGGGNVNNDGVVEPDLGPDSLIITGGNYSQNPSGKLLINIGGTGPSEYGQLKVVGGKALLNGELRIFPIDLGGGPYTPSAGDRFDILAASGGFAGTEFATLVAPSSPGLAWDIINGANVTSLGVFLDADFDHDGDVDGQDFIVWQRGRGTLNPKHTDGDADGDSDVDGDDLTRWKLSFGNSVPVLPAGLAVPEPASLVLALIGVLCLGGKRTLLPFSQLHNPRS